RTHDRHDAAQVLAFQTFHHEQTGLLYFHQESRLIVEFGGDRNGQNNFIVVAVDTVAAGVQIDMHLRAPLFGERLGAERCFEGRVLYVDALQRKLLFSRIGVFSHVASSFYIATACVAALWRLKNNFAKSYCANSSEFSSPRRSNSYRSSQPPTC